MTISLLALPIAFLIALAWGPWLIERLRDLRFGKRIRVEGQEHHMAKQGTPTMGGWLFIVTSGGVIAATTPWATVALPIGASMLLFGAFGALDDYANIKNREGVGFQIRAQLLWQVLLAAAIGAAIYFVAGVDSTRIPGIGSIALGAWMIPFAALVIYATASGANIIDGLDGLAGGTIAIALVVFAIVAARAGQWNLATAILAIVGAILGFLWFNVHPARLFMGGAGSLAIGAALGTVALLTEQPFILPIVGGLFVLVLLSVILQVGYFRLTGGKRLFKRAPFHHHLELSGWPEVQIVFRSWVAAAVLGAIGLAVSSI